MTMFDKDSTRFVYRYLLSDPWGNTWRASYETDTRLTPEQTVAKGETLQANYPMVAGVTEEAVTATVIRNVLPPIPFGSVVTYRQYGPTSWVAHIGRQAIDEGASEAELKRRLRWRGCEEPKHEPMTIVVIR